MASSLLSQSSSPEFSNVASYDASQSSPMYSSGSFTAISLVLKDGGVDEPEDNG